MAENLNVNRVLKPGQKYSTERNKNKTKHQTANLINYRNECVHRSHKKLEKKKKSVLNWSKDKIEVNINK